MSKSDYFDTDPKTGQYRDISTGKLGLEYHSKDNLKFIVAHPRTGEQRPIPVGNLQKALSLGFKPSQNEVKVAHPKTKEVRPIPAENLQKALSLGFTIPRPGAKDFGQAAVRGIGKTLGNLGDTVIAASSYAMAKNPLVNIASNVSGGAIPNSEQLQEQAQDYWKNPKLERTASDYFQNNITTPGLEAVETAGEFVGEVPGFKGVNVLAKAGNKALKLPWLDKVNKFLDVPLGDAKTAAKTVAGFAGAGAGSELAKSDDPNVGVVEDIARQVLGITLGAATGEAIPNAGIKATRAIAQTLTHPIETLKDFGITAATLPFRGKVNKEVYDKAKELGIELTPAMLTDSYLAKFAENNVFESIFVAGAYKKAIDNISPSVLKTIDEKLALTVGKKVEPTATESAGAIVSRDIGQQFEKNVERWKTESDNLFNLSEGSLTSSDKMAVPQTIKTIESMISELEGGITAAEGTERTVLDYITQLKAGLEQNNEHALTDLIKEQKRLLKKGKYGNVQGYENYYNGIAGTLIDELAGYTGNKSFHENYGVARAYFKNNIVNGVRNKITQSLLHEYSPKEAINFMNNKQNIETLERLLGDSKNGKELMGSLKRAKIQEILDKNNVFTVNEEFNPDAFLRIFKKNDDMLKTLMGEGYGELKNNIVPIANAISTSRKTLNNKSNTAKAAAQYSILIGLTTWSGLKTAGLSIGGIYGLSAAMANPKFVEKLIARSKSPRFTSRVKNLPNKPAVKLESLKSGAEFSGTMWDNSQKDRDYNEESK